MPCVRTVSKNNPRPQLAQLPIQKNISLAFCDEFHTVKWKGRALNPVVTFHALTASTNERQRSVFLRAQIKKIPPRLRHLA
jgi:hypothetical protein